MFWRADDFETVLAYRLQWRSGNDFIRQDIVDLGGSWLVRDLICPTAPGIRRDNGRGGDVVVALGAHCELKNLPDPRRALRAA